VAVVEQHRDESPKTDEARTVAASFDIKPRRWLYLLLAYFTLHVAIRTLLSSSADGDEAEQVMLAQQALSGYGSQPPLYTWLQIGFFSSFGVSVFSLALLKNLLLAGTYLLTYWNAKLVTRSKACGLAAALSLLFIEQIAWESQRDLTHSVLGATMAAATLLSFLRTHESKRLGWYISLGLCLGLGCLAKYNYLFWPLALTVAALSIPELRRTVLDKRMLLAVAICVLVFLPNGVWILHHRADAFASDAKFNVQNAGSLLAAYGVTLRHLITAVLKFLGPLVLVYWGVFGTARGRRGEALTFADDSAPAVYKLFLKRSLLVVGVLLAVLVLGFRIAGIRDRWLQPVLIFAPVLAVAVVRERLDAVRLKRLVAASGVVMLLVSVGLPGRIILAEKLNRKEFLTHPYRQIAQEMAGAIPEFSRVLTPTRLMAGNLRLHMPNRLFVSFADNALFADNQEHCFIAWDTEGSEQTPYLVRLWLQGHGPGSGLPAGAVRYFTAPYQYHHQRQMRVALVQIR
jgi:lipopolysaccharide core galacturonosyltransferase RgtB